MPKGCLLSHGYYTIIPTGYEENGWVIATDRVFTAMPMFHTGGGAIILMCALTMGSSVVYQPQFSASRFIWEARENDATMLLSCSTAGLRAAVKLSCSRVMCRSVRSLSTV